MKIFESPSEKLQLSAKIVFWLGVISAVIIYFGYFNSNSLLLGLFVAVLDVLACYLTSLLLYAFGEVLSKLSKISATRTTIASHTTHTLSNIHKSVDTVAENTKPTFEKSQAID